MIVEIIKEHVNGLSVGLVKDFTENVANKLIRDGYAVEATSEQLIEYRNNQKEVISARSRMIKQRIEDEIIEKEREAVEKKNSDADADHVISEEEIEAIRCKAYEAGQADGYSSGHAEGYKLGYDACLAEMANNIIKEPEATSMITEGEPKHKAVEPSTEPEAEPDKPKRGRPSNK